MRVMESLVQVTVVAGPPVETQKRVSWSELKTISPDIVTSPVVKRVDVYNTAINSLIHQSNLHNS